MTTPKKPEEIEEERQYRLAEKERKAEEKEDTSPSAAGNAPADKPIEDPKPVKPAGPVEPGAQDTDQTPPSIKENKPEGGEESAKSDKPKPATPERTPYRG